MSDDGSSPGYQTKKERKRENRATSCFFLQVFPPPHLPFRQNPLPYFPIPLPVSLSVQLNHPLQYHDRKHIPFFLQLSSLHLPRSFSFVAPAFSFFFLRLGSLSPSPPPSHPPRLASAAELGCIGVLGRERERERDVEGEKRKYLWSFFCFPFFCFFSPCFLLLCESKFGLG